MTPQAASRLRSSRLGRHPAAHQEGEAGVGGAFEAAAAEDRRHDQRDQQIDQVLVERHHRRALGLAHAPRHQGRDRIGQRRGDRQQRGEDEGIRSRPHDDEHAEETDDGCDPAAHAHLLAQERAGERRHEQRHREPDRHDAGERHRREGEIVGGVGHHQHQAAHDQQAHALRPQAPELAGTGDEDEQDHHGDDAADRDRLVHRIVAAQELDDPVLAGKDRDPAAQAEGRQAWMPAACRSRRNRTHANPSHAIPTAPTHASRPVWRQMPFRVAAPACRA